MRRSRISVVLGSCFLLGTPAAGVAGMSVTPRNGTLQARLGYKLGTQSESSLLRVTLVGHKIKAVHVTTNSLLPYNPKLSHGLCNELTRISTDGDKSQGRVRRNGRFGYTFSVNTSQYADKVTIRGVFTSPNQAEGKFRDIYTLKGGDFGSHCDTGRLNFTASRR